MWNSDLSWGASPPKPPTNQKGKGLGHREARLLCLAVITNVYQQGKLTTEDARELLDGPLTPGKLDTVYHDSVLLGDTDGLAKIKAEYESGT